MRKPYPFYSLLTLGGLFLAGSCSIIAEVDRTKIPTDGGIPEGGDGSGATSSTGGKGGSSGAGTTGGSAGTSGEGGMGGEPGGGTGGAGGDPGGMGGEPGMGGDGGEPPTPVCGDGTIDVGIGEECDDGDMPPAGTDGCSATCDEEPGWDCIMTPSVCSAAACGDRIIAGAEVCDDGNNTACGTCSVGCGTSTPATAATGTISPGVGAPGDLVDGDFFTLNDGAHPAVVFEFDEATSGDGVEVGSIAIAFDVALGTPAALQTAIITAINAVPDATLAITATAGTPVPNVILTNQVAGVTGNRANSETVANTTFMISNMAGGVARDCATGVGCNVGADCLSGTCTANICN